MSHLWLGLLSSIIVFIVCLSGSIYAFKNQIEYIADRDILHVSPSDSINIPLDSVLSRFEAQFGPATRMEVYPEAHRSILISSFSKESKGVTAYYDPYSGEFLGLKNQTVEAFLDFILDLHRFLLAGDTGKFINGTAVLIMVYMLLSGFILWLPKKLKKLVSRMGVRWRARFYRVNYDLHSVLGFWSILLLFFIAVTGLYVSFTWVKNAVIVGLGGDSIIISEGNTALKKSLAADFDAMLQGLKEENQKLQVENWSVDNLMVQTHDLLAYQGKTILLLPNETIKTIGISKIRNDNWAGFYVPDQLEFSTSGSLRKVQKFYDLPLHEQFKLIAKPLHTGEIMGLPSIILYFIVSLIGCSLPITGFIIWWKRKK